MLVFQSLSCPLEGWKLRVCKKVNLNATGYFVDSFELMGGRVHFLKLNGDCCDFGSSLRFEIPEFTAGFCVSRNISCRTVAI